MKKTKPKDVELPFAYAHVRLGISPGTLKGSLRKGCPHQYRRSGKPGPPTVWIPMRAASEWLLANGVRLGRKQIPLSETPAAPEPAPAPAAQEPPPPAPNPPAQAGPPPELGYFASVERMKRVEISCFNDYVVAKRSGNLALSLAAFRNWESAQKRLAAGEMDANLFQTLKKKAMEEAHHALNEWCEPVRVFLDGMPRALANRGNPTNPAHLEKVLRDWLHTQLYPMMSQPLKGHEGISSKADGQ